MGRNPLLLTGDSGALLAIAKADPIAFWSARVAHA
jgi:hypothetical protein